MDMIWKCVPAETLNFSCNLSTKLLLIASHSVWKMLRFCYVVLGDSGVRNNTSSTTMDASRRSRCLWRFPSCYVLVVILIQLASTSSASLHVFTHWLLIAPLNSPRWIDPEHPLDPFVWIVGMVSRELFILPKLSRVVSIGIFHSSRIWTNGDLTWMYGGANFRSH